MRTFRELPKDGLLRRVRPRVLFTLLGLSLAACGGGGGGSDNSAPPPPPPPPPPGGNVPPLSSTVIDVTNGQAQGADHWPNGDTSTGGQGQPVAGLDCLATVPDTYHVHTHLSIFLNGQQLAVPAAIGFVQAGQTTTCTYQLHTHSKSGLLHVHAPAAATFTLGQIFQIWGQPLSSTDIAGLTGMPVRVFVVDNGTVTENTGDWSAIELTSHRTITIQVGTDISAVPNVTWSGP
jgi:hypothetical protein